MNLALPGEIYRDRRRPRFVRVLAYEHGLVDFRTCDHAGMFGRRKQEWLMLHGFHAKFVKIGHAQGGSNG